MLMDGRDPMRRLNRISHLRGLAHSDFSKCQLSSVPSSIILVVCVAVRKMSFSLVTAKMLYTPEPLGECGIPSYLSSNFFRWCFIFQPHLTVVLSYLPSLTKAPLISHLLANCLFPLQLIKKKSSNNFPHGWFSNFHSYFNPLHDDFGLYSFHPKFLPPAKHQFLQLCPYC